MKKQQIAWVGLLLLLLASAGTVFAEDGCREVLQGKWQLEPRGEEEARMLQELGGQIFFEFNLAEGTLTMTLGEQTKSVKVAVKECTAERAVLNNAEENAAEQPDLNIEILKDGRLQLTGADMTQKDRPTILKKVN